MPPSKNLEIAFTLNPDPKKYRSTDPVDQWTSLLLCLFLKPSIRKTFSYFYFTPELTQDGNVHVHGWMEVQDSISFYRWFIPACKAWGFIKIKHNPDDDWLAYIMKDSDLMFDLFADKLPIYLDNDNVLTWNNDLRKNTMWMTQRQRNQLIPKKIKRNYNLARFFK